MDDSPLISPSIKEYASKHKIESVLNDMIQQVLTRLPSDPYSLMCSIIKDVKLNYIIN